VAEEYDPNAKRHHCTSNLGLEVREAFGEELELYPTIYPEPAKMGAFTSNPSAIPPVDGLAIAAPSLHIRRIPSRLEGNPGLPFIRSSVLDTLRCGNATFYNIGNAADPFDFEPGFVSVCDMATYPWSNTLKDPRTWAVVNTAIEANFKHLGVWTAGNAGLSLAKVAYIANRLLPPERRIKVYCYSLSGSLPVELQRILRSFGAEPIEFPETESGGSIFTTEYIWRRLNNVVSPPIPRDEFWEVTDGMDGVGLYMYRMIGRQICLYLKPKYIVAPLGTGDLFFGLSLGRQDCLNAKLIKSTDCKMVGAVPALPANVLANYTKYGLELPIAIPAGAAPPIAPKLDTIYTPLLLVMYQSLLQADLNYLIPIKKSAQIRAATILMHIRNELTPAAEPSALIGFAALPALAHRHAMSRPTRVTMRKTPARARVVVVNSGFGILSGEDFSLYQDLVGGPTTA
jgi:hypothetical protein